MAVLTYSSPQRTQRKSKEDFLTHHSSYPVEQVRDVEVQEKPHSDAAQLQIGQQLRFVDRKNRFNGLDFQNYPLFNPKINPERSLDSQSVINDCERNLGLDNQAGFGDFMLELAVVGAFDKTRTERGMNFERASNRGFRNVIDFHTSLFSSVSSVVKG